MSLKATVGPIGRLPALFQDAVRHSTANNDAGAAKVRWKWATAVNADPLQVVLDGETTPIPVKSQNCLIPVTSIIPPTRVWVQQYKRRVIVIGQAGGGHGWTNVQLLNGYRPRPDAAQYQPQVMLDGSGLVHFRGQIDAKSGGLSGAAEAVLQLPEWAYPKDEVRWIGFATLTPSKPYGGWVTYYGGSDPGQLFIRNETGRSDPAPTSHWSIIIPAWEPVPVNRNAS